MNGGHGGEFVLPASIVGIQSAINQRQNELHDVADIIASAATHDRLISSAIRVLLVILGSLSATKAVVDQLLGTSNAGVTVVFTAIGLLTATLAGLEASFRFERRAAEQTVLAAEAHATLREVDSQWQKEIGTGEPTTAIAAARRLLDVQDKKLADIQSRAARGGFNIAERVRRRLSESALARNNPQTEPAGASTRKGEEPERPYLA